MATNLKKSLEMKKILKLLRKYGFDLKTITIELHVFADTSLCAYKTVAYFRFIQEHNFKCMFIA